jgi:UDP-N-acetylmuramoyl-L-alanyl-D-glutamate--2,6-diaminopimelate ligase
VSSAGDVPRPARVTPVPLGELARLAETTVDGPESQISGITASSDRIRPGDLFAAIPGLRTHGARFASDAARAGAVAVLTDAAGTAHAPPGLPTLVVTDVRAVLGAIASRVYGDPSGALRVQGVTGTSGKTTTTFFLRAGLAAAGRTPGLVGTVATMIGADRIETGFTTPEAPDLHALLAVMRERGVTDVAMEVSSHALELGRVGGVAFEVGGFTNLSQDHLDFHPSMEDYFAAKRRLFESGARPVVVVDDEWGRTLAGTLVDVTTVSTASRAATWSARAIIGNSDGTIDFVLDGPAGAIPARTSIPGRFNVANAALAIALLHSVGVAPSVAAEAIAQAVVPGRMERIDEGQPFLAVVDYSHKPAAVQSALAALRPLTAQRLIVVLGCGGDRDRAKRPMMGEIAARGSDLLIVTDDNPRSEDPAAIRREMLLGAEAVPPSQRGQVRQIADRAAAIAEAVRAAGAGDCVLIAGKGHETGQEIDGVVHPFDDGDVVRAALREVLT